MPSTPNLLFLYTDEQRYDTLACYGNSVIHMPNLNRFAESATVFDQAYVTQPVCTPSRASLLTGLTPHTCRMHTNNLTLPETVRCLPEFLPSEYTCAHHGKWHLGDEIFAQHGFTEWRGTEDTYHAFYGMERDQAERSSFHHFLVANGHAPWPNDLPPEIGTRFFRDQIMQLPEEHSRPAFLAREASRFLTENRDRPFCLYVNFLEPHMPFSSCRDSQYDPAGVTLPANAMHELDDSYSRRVRRSAESYRSRGFGPDKPLANEEQWRRLTAKYWGMCSLVDTHVGTILDTLEKLGLNKNTVVVFTTDHGDMMSSHNLLGKGYMFEESTRVPLLIRLPGQTTQKRLRGPVSQVDVVPTLLDALGQRAPSELEGLSRLSAVREGSDGTGDDVFIEWHGDGAGRQPEPRNLPPPLMPKPGKEPDPVSAESIRTVVTADNWKLNVSSIGDHELYDLGTDPVEYHNLARDRAHRERIALMVAKINGWQECTADQTDWCTVERVLP